jgi:hypothetical protein
MALDNLEHFDAYYLRPGSESYATTDTPLFVARIPRAIVI